MSCVARRSRVPPREPPRDVADGVQPPMEEATAHSCRPLGRVYTPSGLHKRRRMGASVVAGAAVAAAAAAAATTPTAASVSVATAIVAALADGVDVGVSRTSIVRSGRRGGWAGNCLDQERAGVSAGRGKAGRLQEGRKS